MSKSASLTTEGILGADGLLAAELEKYEFREEQLSMASAVLSAFQQRKPLIVEAATGTGKSLAYLTAALISGKTTIVSTGTKALQDQLFQKDIPLLAKIWPRPVRAAILKGRKNYLCRLRFEEMRARPRFVSKEEARIWPTILAWANVTEDGDRQEVEGLPDDAAIWNDLSVGPEACLSTRCPHWDSCHVNIVRKKAEEADIVVVNHHLFFADLAVRQSGFGAVLPEYDAVVFDEAHHIEEVATSYFGMQVSNWRLRDLEEDIKRTMATEESSDDGVLKALEETRQKGALFFSEISLLVGQGSWDLRTILESERRGTIDAAARQMDESMTQLARALTRNSELGEVGERLVARTKEIQAQVQHIIKAEDPRYCYFLEIRERGQFLQAAPIEVSRVLRQHLLSTHDTLVFTSATLSTGGDFSFFKKRIGAEAIGPQKAELAPIPLEELKLAPIFSYEEQCLLYIPRRLAEPRSPQWLEDATTVIEYLLGLSKGRAFVLFTSYMNMNAVYDRLAHTLPYQTLRQGDASRTELLEAFRKDTHSVLFATSSFWEGVDVEGEALSMVIIDKLPFASPSDPLTRARLTYIDEKGGNSFGEYSLPTAALALKQGFGRLIRSRDDSGVVAILDSRLAQKSYGRYFIDSLPPAPLVWRAAQVRDWWAARNGIEDPGSSSTES